jgi:hypothetical protein
MSGRLMSPALTLRALLLLLSNCAFSHTEERCVEPAQLGCQVGGRRPAAAYTSFSEFSRTLRRG